MKSCWTHNIDLNPGQVLVKMYYFCSPCYDTEARNAMAEDEHESQCIKPAKDWHTKLTKANMYHSVMEPAQPYATFTL